MRVRQSRMHRNAGFERSAAIQVERCCNMDTVSNSRCDVSVARSTVLSAPVLEEGAVALPPQASGIVQAGRWRGWASGPFGVVDGVVAALQQALSGALEALAMQAGAAGRLCSKGARTQSSRLARAVRSQPSDDGYTAWCLLGVSRYSQARVLLFGKVRAAS